VRLRDLASRPGARLRYTYDFGDSWEHDLLVEDILPPDGVPHAVCLTGRRAGPPEDCGGIWGYAELCDILADPSHPDHAERVDWLGHLHDPAAFDKDATNTALARIRLG
jgi:Plasmid pRiA4b ORF-3-like protein